MNVLGKCLQTSGAVKLYLFDVFTKLAIAADSAPDDSLQFHVCSDVIDIAVDVGTICWSVTASVISTFPNIVRCLNLGRLVASVVTTTSIILSSSNIQKGGIPVLTYPGYTAKWQLNKCHCHHLNLCMLQVCVIQCLVLLTAKPKHRLGCSVFTQKHIFGPVLPNLNRSGYNFAHAYCCTEYICVLT